MPPALTSDSLTVYIFLHDECMICQFYTPRLTEFYNQYHAEHVGFVGFFPDPSVRAPEAKAFAEKYGIRFPLKSDFNKVWTKKLGVTVTPEVAVWDHREDRLIYRGRIDDSYVRVGKRKTHIQHEDLKNIIDAWLAGEVPNEMIETQVVGCLINFNDSSAPVSPKGGQ